MLNQVRQAAAGEQLHDDHKAPVDLAQLVHRHDVGMLQPGHQARFALEALDEIGVDRQLRVEHFDRHLALQRQVGSAVDRAEPALAQNFMQLILPQSHGYHLDLNGFRSRGFPRINSGLIIDLF
jgi:hypothetical protein